MKQIMKKIQLMLHHEEKEIFLHRLQELGILHLESDDQDVSPEVDELISQKDELVKAEQLLQEPSDKQNGIVVKNAYEFASKIHGLKQDLDNTQNEIDRLNKEAASLEVWGNFDGKYIEKLKGAGIQTSFFTGSTKVFQKYDFGDLPVAEVTKDKGQTYFIAFSEEDVEIPFDVVVLPEQNFQAIQSQIEHLKSKRKEIDDVLASCAGGKGVLLEEINNLNDKILYQQTSKSFSTFGESKIHYIQGWIPEKQLTGLQDFLNRKKVAYIVSDADIEDHVPVILKNRTYPKIFESITKIFELPHYRELDLTPVIAVFYPIFFAYCLGDSGYGLILSILFVVGYFKFLKDNRVFAILGVVLGLFTMVIGIVKAGTLFGIPIVEHRDIAFFDFFAQFTIIPEKGDTPFNAFNVALILGVCQILVGVLSATIRAWMYESFEASIASIGKFIIIVSCVVLFLGSQGTEIFIPFTSIATYGIITGIVLVLCFHNVRIPLMKRVAGGFLPVYFIFTGLIGDVLSYIRLFALGIASGILGLVVNTIAMQIMGGGIPGILLGIVFLLFGHGLNLFISGLGSFVHPLRLTFVEFYNNAGFKGGGVPYKPFRKDTI